MTKLLTTSRRIVRTTAATSTVLGLVAAAVTGTAAVSSAALAAPNCLMTPAANGITAANGGRVDLLDTSAQLLPTQWQEGAATGTVCSARDGFASFQLEVTAKAGALSGVSMAASSLTGANGTSLPATDVRLYREGYDKLTTMTDGELASVLPRDASGNCIGDCEFPDSLIPDVDTLFNQKRNAFPFTVAAGQNQAVWADVFVPAGQAPGVYTGTVTVTQSTGGATAVPISLTVVNATLPATSTSHSAFYLSLGALGLSGSQYGAEYAKYAELGLEDRISVIPNNPLSATDLSTYVAPLLTGTDRKVRLTGASLTDFQIKPSWQASDFATYQKFLASIGQTAKGQLYCDEVTPASCASSYAPVAASWPGLKVLGTDIPEALWPDPENGVAPAALASSMQVVIPPAYYIDPASGENPYKANGVGNRMPYLNAWKAQAAGRQVWAYTTCTSGGCGNAYSQYNSAYTLYGWPSYGIDQPASEQVAMGWQMFSYGLDGEEYFDTMSNPHIATDPYNSSAGWGMNGDGTLFYPYDKATVGGTTPIPLESIRLKRIREGRQDNELLKLTSAGTAMALAKATFTAMVNSKISAATLDNAENQLMGFYPVPAVTPVTPVTPVSPVVPAKVGSHDLDCNGTPDFLAVQAGSGNLLFYPRTATDWTPNAPITVGTGFGGAYQKLMLAGDLNGDGSPDLVGRKADGSLWLMAGNCTGSFATAVSMAAGTTNPTPVGDFNGDGIADLVDQHTDGTLWLLAGNGKGGFAPAVQAGNGWGSFTITGVGDVNGDGFADIMARTADGTTLMYEGDGKGGWNAATENGGLAVSVKLPLVNDPQVIGAGDLSGDGKADIEAIDSAGHMTRYNGDGTGNVAATGATVGNGWIAAVLSQVAY